MSNEKRMRCVWLNINTGEFSLSWWEDEYESESLRPEALAEDVTSDSIFKLIRYECISDDEFSFNNLMRLR